MCVYCVWDNEAHRNALLTLETKTMLMRWIREIEDARNARMCDCVCVCVVELALDGSDMAMVFIEMPDTCDILTIAASTTLTTAHIRQFGEQQHFLRMRVHLRSFGSHQILCAPNGVKDNVVLHSKFDILAKYSCIGQSCSTKRTDYNDFDHIFGIRHYFEPAHHPAVR